MHNLTLEHIDIVSDGKALVRDVSLSVSGGSVSVLMGPNGSGKSSLVNGICGHPQYRVTKGTVTLNDEDVTALSAQEKANKGLFLSLQHTPKIGGTTLAAFLHKIHTVRHGSDAVSMLEFYSKLVDMSEQFSLNRALLDRPISAGLSGGEKKTSELLQLLVFRPKIAILDEIDSGVDIDALRAVFAVIDSLKRSGTGFLIISHHPSLLTHLSPEHVHIMSRGAHITSGGYELAETVVKKGFCAVAGCTNVSNCSGICCPTSESVNSG